MNHHQTNKENSISELYLKNELGYNKKCPKRSCKGFCVEVWVKYRDHGQINYEWECTSCGKVVKDMRFFNNKNRS